MTTNFLRLWVAVAMLCTASPSVSSAEHSVDQTTDIKQLTKRVRSGDSIVLENGQWKDIKLTFDRLPGTKDSPITISARTPGQVVFTGKSQFRFSGQHVVISGLVFRDTEFSDVFESRTHSQRHAHHCRITDCDFHQTKSAPTGKESRWLSLYGTHNRVDHCRFSGKRSKGTTLVVWIGESPNHHLIDHNYFGERPELGRNGGETIRIGTSETANQNSKTLVKDNYFDRCNGEAEIISNKSCENMYRHNVFVQCRGALTLRHGHRCVVDANEFRGNKEKGTGGVRIIGSSHVVTNNYFANLRGDEMRAAISMMNSPANDKPNGYTPVRDAIVAHNTFVDCKVPLEIGVEASDELNVAPSNCQITSNLFAAGKWSILRAHAKAVNFRWKNNLQRRDVKSPNPPDEIKTVDVRWQDESSNRLIPVASDNLQVSVDPACPADADGRQRRHPTQCGCDHSAGSHRIWVNESTSGPTWIRTSK